MKFRDGNAKGKDMKSKHEKGAARHKGAKSKSARSGGAPKNCAEYVARVPEGARGMLKKMRAAIRSVLPREAVETISYGIPAYRTEREVLVWFAGFAKHCSLFPKASVIGKFKKELKGFTVSKGTIQFPLDKALPIGLIKRIVKARVAETESHP